jgi:alkylation response protein AidB-like acyl-CoA dehydrogenase
MTPTPTPAAVGAAADGSVPPVAVTRTADRLHHDLLFDDETRAVRDEVRRFADARVGPRAQEIAATEEAVDAFPGDVFDAMGQAGLFGIPFDAEHGGRGLDRPVCATAVTIEELAYHSSSIGAIYDVHCILAGHALEFGSPHVRERWLAPLIAGELVGAFATTEPGASSDLSPEAVQTFATVTGGGYRLDGRKRFITNAPVADVVVVLAKVQERLTLFAVDTRIEGLRVGPPDRKLGNRGQLTADVVLDDVFVPVSDRIGAEGEGLRLALATLTYGRVGIAASGVGMAQAAFDRTVAHLLERSAFGRRLAEFQHWQFRMSEHATRLENARNLYAKAARLMDEGVAFPEPEASMAKAYATELAVDLARDAIQAMGGYGFLREVAADGTSFRVEEIYRDAKIAEIYEGTNEIQRMITARTIFGKDVVG